MYRSIHCTEVRAFSIHCVHMTGLHKDGLRVRLVGRSQDKTALTASRTLLYFDRDKNLPSKTEKMMNPATPSAREQLAK